MASTLMNAITETVRKRLGDSGLPELREFFLHDPLPSELEDGGKLITLSFREDVEELLPRWETDLPCLISAVVCTLTTFIPGLTAVSVRIGDTPVTELGNAQYHSDVILGGLVQRNAAARFLAGNAVVFMEKDGALIRCDKPVEQQMSDSPRAMIRALIEGPDRKDRENGVRSPLPGAITEDDVLGIAAEGDTLLVNLSDSFRQGIREHGPEKEAIVCYSMVNTLCLNSVLRRVCFFFEGVQEEKIAGEIYWAGTFMYNPQI